MEEVGMTDLQFKAYLRAVIEDFEKVKKLGVSDEAKAEIEAIVARYQKSVEE